LKREPHFQVVIADGEPVPFSRPALDLLIGHCRHAHDVFHRDDVRRLALLAKG